MQIRNVRPWEVEIPNVGLVAAGATVDVPDDVAGHPPKGDDPGSGLLAQPDNWAAATRGARSSEEA